ncbi:MAG: hypothetical protein ACI9VT_002121 [Psychroserpens sp.]|jgi:hypothetical protein
MPSYDDREHVNILVSPDIEKDIIPELIATIKQLKGKKVKDVDQHVLAVLDKYRAQNHDIVAIYNHPSRKDADVAENIADIQSWNAKSKHIVGFAGAPGHQKQDDVGSYRKHFKTIDRWDPAIATVGGTWDELLSAGHNIWGAIASSDFHNDSMDEAPCEFARIHVLVTENSYSGILKGLKAGTFWADHGKILKAFNMQIRMDGIVENAAPGAIVSIGKNTLAEVTIDIERDVGSKDSPLFVELISNCRSGDVELYENKVLDLNSETFFSLLPLLNTGSDKKSCFVRARIRKMNFLEPDFMAYGNSIRFILD